MTHLDFLIDLLLNHKLQKSTKDLIQNRIKEVQAEPTQQPAPSSVRQAPKVVPQIRDPHAQAASTQAILADGESTIIPEPVHVTPPTLAQLASNPQAAAALARRQEIMGQGMAGTLSKNKPLVR